MFTVCLRRQRKTQKARSIMDMRKLIRNQTDVALSLAKTVLSKDKTNVVFSPLSIHVLLSLIAAGSEGPTRDQLLSFLKAKTTDHLNSLASELVTVVLADGSSVGGPKLCFANGVWVQKSIPLKPSFKQVVGDLYKADNKLVDFKTKAAEAAGEVNSWAEKQTGGLIKVLLPAKSVDASTRLIFTNALYFKGAWNEKFDASETEDDEFHLLNGSSVQVPFMTSRKKQAVKSFDGFKVLRLPYKQGEDKRRFSMYIFLPDARDGISALVEKIGSEAGFLDKHLPYEQVKVGEFKVPRFKIFFGFEASETLKKLGVVLPFSDKARLTEMVDSPQASGLYVSSMFHTSFVEVNEEGTEAAAASVTRVRTGLDYVKKIDFVADHPFVFLIREDGTGTVQFIGQVLNPLSD